MLLGKYVEITYQQLSYFWLLENPAAWDSWKDKGVRDFLNFQTRFYWRVLWRHILKSPPPPSSPYEYGQNTNPRNFIYLYKEKKLCCSHKEEQEGELQPNKSMDREWNICRSSVGTHCVLLSNCLNTSTCSSKNFKFYATQGQQSTRCLTFMTRFENSNFIPCIEISTMK